MVCSNCRREIAGNSNFCYYCGARQAPFRSPLAARRLMRSATNRKFAGVCAGFGEYFEVDATLVRLLWVLITFLSGIIPGIVVYLIAWFIMPEALLPVPATSPAEKPAPQGAQPA